MLMKHAKLFDSESVFVMDGDNQIDVFQAVAKKLTEQDLVKPGFLESIITREKNYPTGINLTPVSTALDNIAIPHTEAEYVKVSRIIPIKLIKPIVFHDMIQPDQQLEVKFLFMILNDNPTGQANILAQIMDFIATTDPQKLQMLFNLTDPQKIYEFLVDNFSK